MTPGDGEFRFCGTLEARSFLESAAAAWRKRALTYYVDGSLPGVSAGTFADAAALAFAQWAAVTPLSFRAATSGETPDVVITAGRIDRPGGVLAWSELPDGSDRQLTQRYDTLEAYALAERPPQGRIDLLAVMTHEIGHALGLDHAAQGSADLMAPVYRPGLRAPQPGDVTRVQGLYGRPSSPPPPPSGVWRVTTVTEIDRLTGKAAVVSVTGGGAS